MAIDSYWKREKTGQHQEKWRRHRNQHKSELDVRKSQEKSKTTRKTAITADSDIKRTLNLPSDEKELPKNKSEAGSSFLIKDFSENLTQKSEKHEENTKNKAQIRSTSTNHEGRKNRKRANNHMQSNLYDWWSHAKANWFMKKKNSRSVIKCEAKPNLKREWKKQHSHRQISVKITLEGRERRGKNEKKQIDV